MRHGTQTFFAARVEYERVGGKLVVKGGQVGEDIKDALEDQPAVEVKSTAGRAVEKNGTGDYL